ncbi:MAG: hypothetical protein NG747_12630 [Candidatus Brocadia sp.]|nr:hypothetical protein [Candidatus Brocadia sp.]
MPNCFLGQAFFQGVFSQGEVQEYNVRVSGFHGRRGEAEEPIQIHVSEKWEETNAKTHNK